MDLEAMQDAVVDIIQDASYTVANITVFINQAIQEAAMQIDLPVLKRIGTVDTVVDQNYALLTSVDANFSGKGITLLSDDIIIYSDLRLLMQEYLDGMDAAGDVEAVCQEGNRLWYQKIPAVAETLNLIYYLNPPLLTEDANIPSDFHESLHFNLFVHGACYQIFNEIEDGIEGEKVNTAYHFNLSFNPDSKVSGITKLKEFLAKNNRHYITSVWNI